MSVNAPKQSPTIRNANNADFVKLLEVYLSERNWTQKALAEVSDLSESMVCRMFNNANGHGDTFDLTPAMVMKIACALTIGWDGFRKLMEVAFPEFTETLEAREPATMLRSRFKENGKPGL